MSGVDGDSGSKESTPISCLDCNKKSCRHYWYLIIKKYWNLATIFIGLMVYLSIGGAIFSALERPNELQNIEDSKLALNRTRIELMEFVCNRTNLTGREAMEFTQQVLQFGRILAEATGNLTLEENPLWDWSSAVFFAVTVLTTIGMPHSIEIKVSLNKLEKYIVIRSILPFARF